MNLDTTIPRRDFVVSSLSISKRASIKHDSVKRSIKRHQKRLEKFGEIRFEIQLGNHKRGVKVLFGIGNYTELVAFIVFCNLQCLKG